MKRVILLTVVSCLLAGFIGCASASKYAEDTEVPWEVFYSATQNKSDFRKLPNIFYVEAYVKLSDDYSLRLYETETASEPARINSGNYSYWRTDQIEEKLEPNKKYMVKIQKKEIQGSQVFQISHISGVPSAAEISYEARRAEEVRQAEEKRAQEAQREEERRQREEERQQPRFSPEGQEYVKRTLLQALGESRNQANRGKTLFFESSFIKITNSRVAGNYLISSIVQNPNDYIIMEFYGNVPLMPPSLAGFTILYRVEINQLGVGMFKIDSLRN
jgi:hypothetical protein